MKIPSLSATEIKAEALRLGFSACGIARVDEVDETTATSFRHWLNNGKEAEMSYMSNYLDKRLDPRLLLDHAHSLISVALNYYPESKMNEEEYQLAWYAYGKDYHDVMKSKLTALQAFIATKVSSDSPLPFQARAFCDTAPLLERYWAWRAGLGWVGKNTQLILPRAGSCFFLGELLITSKVDVYDLPHPNRCGSCTRCLQACPTNALEAPYSLNAKRCLSYLTIEYRGDLSPVTAQKMGKKIYGCDDCVKACPWNRFSTPCQTPELQPSPTLLAMKRTDWHMLTEEQYRTLFKGSAVKRAKYSGLMRNIHAAERE